MQAAGSEDAPDGDHHGVAEHRDTYKYSHGKPRDGTRAGGREERPCGHKRPRLSASKKDDEEEDSSAYCLLRTHYRFNTMQEFYVHLLLTLTPCKAS